MIKYEYTEGRNDCAIRVKLDGRIAGTIRPVTQGTNTRAGWQYFPKGQREGGEVFKTLEGCQRSLAERETEANEMIEKAKLPAPEDQP